MGQYYRFYLNNGKEEKVMCPFDYGNTFKLMEHSWVGNYFVNCAVAALQDMGEAEVIHMGDYAEDVGVDHEKYDKVWGTNEDGVDLYTNLRCRDLYEFDKGEQVFIVCEERGEYIRYCFDSPVDKYGQPAWYVNTFALLTALGNGLGGGDYWGQNPHMVGIWAGKKLKVVKEEPVGLKKIHGWIFKED